MPRLSSVAAIALAVVLTQFGHLFKDRERRVTERDAVFPAGFHANGRDRPHALGKVDFLP